MSVSPGQPTASSDKKGLWAAMVGVLLFLGGMTLSTLCCWAPALIIGLGLTSVFALLHGVRGLFLGVGAALVVVGLGWSLYRRHKGSCDCRDDQEMT